MERPIQNAVCLLKNQEVWDAIVARALSEDATQNGSDGRRDYSWRESRFYKTVMPEFLSSVREALSNTQFREATGKQKFLDQVIDAAISSVKEGFERKKTIKRFTDEQLKMAIVSLKQANPNIWGRIKTWPSLPYNGAYDNDSIADSHYMAAIFAKLSFMPEPKSDPNAISLMIQAVVEEAWREGSETIS